MIPRLAAVAAMLAVLSVWTHARSRAIDVAPFDFAAAVPFTVGEWQGSNAPPLDPDVARVLAADQYVHRYYELRTGAPPSESDSWVEIDIAYYTQPQAGVAMHSPLNCLPGNGWQVIDSRAALVALQRSTVDVRELVVARGPHRVAMTYWFQNRGAVVGNEYRQRLQLLANGLHGQPTDAALVRVMTSDTAAGRVAVDRFTRELITILNAGFK